MTSLPGPTSSEEPEPAEPTRRERRRARRVDEILAMTARLVGDRGYAMTSIDDIAEQLDLAKASLYHYFDSKESLVYAMLEACHLEVTGELRAIADGPGSATDRLSGLIEAQIRLSTTDMPGSIRLFLRPLDWPSALGAAVNGWREEHDDIFRAVIEEGVKQGEFAIPQPAVNRLCMQGAMAFLPEWYRPGPTTDDAVVRTLMRLFVD